MAEYIDKQATISAIHGAVYSYFCGAEDGDALSEDEKLVLSVNKAICGTIKAFPPADVVEVIRCKDCRHYDLAENGVNGDCDRQYATFYAWDFCSYGKRR